MSHFAFKTASKLLDHALSLDYFQPDGNRKAIIPYFRVSGRDPLAVLVGDNASGKSFARRIITLIANQEKVEPMRVSMEDRSGGGIMNAFVYGAEQWESTGQISARTVEMGISSAQSREREHIIFWDEPDLGLSDDWAAGVGVAIRDFAMKPPKLTRGIFVVTHSKALVSQLLPAKPHYVYFGDGKPPATLAQWVDRPVVPRDITTLGDISHKRFRRIQKILDRLKKR